MKKFYIILAIVVSISILLATYCYYNPRVGTFDLNEYNDKIQMFPSDEVFGKVESARSAKDIANQLWKDIYGTTANQKIPYRVFYDEDNKTWLVSGSMLFIFPSGPYLIITSEEGKVLAVWNEKF